VAEIDESDGTQMAVESYISLVTNIEGDHLENYPGGLDEIVKAMRKFVLNTKKAVVLCADDPCCLALKEDIAATSALPVVTYGLRKPGRPCDFSFEHDGSFAMRVFRKEEPLGTVQLTVPGEHNKYNALATIAIGLQLGIDFETMAASLKNFGGVNRRFQILGEEKSILVVDDYAHHPTEVDATLRGARQYIEEHRGSQKSRLVVLFQPHQPGRLANHWQEFLRSFDAADVVFISDIYVARGKSIEGITSQKFVNELKHENAHYVPGPVSELASRVIPFLKPNDLIMTVGAGDITSVGPQILDYFKQS
jgi:UDP-N-acetylmuramate--alanine ligase